MQYTVALAGNPNSGKTTLFNELTGASAHVGNWPGVTVEKKEGKIRRDTEATLVDLPGIYSLSPYTLEEVVARKYLLESRPDVIINIVDASNLERNLYLTTQLLETGIPTVIACNMMDIVDKNGDSLNSKALSEKLGAPVVEISALRAKGLDELIKTVKETAEKNIAPKFSMTYTEKIENLLSEIETEQGQYEYIGTSAESFKQLNSRWLAIKLFEQDEKVLEDVKAPESLLNKIKTVEDALDDDAQSLVSTARYAYISSILSQVYKKKNADALTFTDRVDKIVTNRWLAFPIFAAVMFIVYYLAIHTIGTQWTDYVNDVVVAEWAQGGAEEFLLGAGVSEWLTDLVVNGIIAGVGAVLGFLPQMAVLFVLLSLLEQCGYMARIAFILDRIFRRFGLSGKSFIPMLIGTGCSVPGIMATRTIENEADRRMTAITTSFIPCSAKLPIIAFIAGAIFADAWWFGPICYFIGIFAVIFSGIILKKTRRFSGDPSPFIMELPEYRLPTLKGIIRSVWERCFAFIKKAGTIILVSSIVLWFLQYFGMVDGQFAAVGEDIDQSFLAKIGNSIAWLFIPLGFGDWQSTVATFTGLIAKENVMSTFAIIFGVADDALELIEDADWEALSSITSHYTTLTAFSFLAFNLLCAPCFAAIGAMHRELGTGKWTLFGVGFQTLLAYSFSLVLYQFGLIFTGHGFTIWTGVAIVVLAVWLYLLFRKQPTFDNNKGKKVSTNLQ